jgi:hypothetical protein
MEETITVPRKAVELMTCTAQVVGEHLAHGYVNPDDAERLRQATSELENAFKPRVSRSEQQRMLWGD